MKKSIVGFIGAGIMGGPMASNLLKGGYNLVVYNRSPEKVAFLKELGAEVVSTPAELMAAADVVVVMVSDEAAVDSVFWGEGGAWARMAPGKAVINMSTVSPAYSVRLAKKLDGMGVQFVDAPVSGSRKPAEDGSLVILAGGRAEVVETYEPLLLCMGKKIVHCGPAGSGAMMKMAVNLLLGVMGEGFAEAAAFARKGGLSLESFLDVVMSGPMRCPLFELKAPMFKSAEFPAQFPLRHMAKDLKYVATTACETGANVPAALSALNAYNQALAQGLGDLDFAAVARLLGTGES